MESVVNFFGFLVIISICILVIAGVTRLTVEVIKGMFQ